MEQTIGLFENVRSALSIKNGLKCLIGSRIRSADTCGLSVSAMLPCCHAMSCLTMSLGQKNAPQIFTVLQNYFLLNYLVDPIHKRKQNGSHFFSTIFCISSFFGIFDFVHFWKKVFWWKLFCKDKKEFFLEWFMNFIFSPSYLSCRWPCVGKGPGPGSFLERLNWT